MQMSVSQTIGSLVVEQPARARVFEKLGIDYCCGGKKSLAMAAREKRIDVELILRELAEADAVAPADQTDWGKASLSDLADHIESTHHEFLRGELPRLSGLVEKVAMVHGERRPELIELRDVFRHFRMELYSHMMKEEKVLFPICRALESLEQAEPLHCGSVQNPIAQMLHEHDEAGRALSRMRQLTGGYIPPADACNSYRAMLHGLEALEANMHQHVHQENNILFPRTVELERRWRSAA